MAQLVETFAQYLAGEFENSAQALEQPAWFVHLHLWYRPLPQLIQGNLAFFAEQAPVLYLERPYRQRVAVLKETEHPQQFQIQYFALQQPDKFLGAGANQNLLNTLSMADLEVLPGCVLTVKQEQDYFTAQPEPGVKCCFQYEEKTRQVVLGLEVSSTQLKSYDKGIDPKTGQALWGAIMGAYEFNKSLDFSAELPLN